jgi:NAD+ synthase (glutamine-hydrolysing)
MRAAEVWKAAERRQESRKAVEMNPFRVALAQINPTVGDLKGNSAKIIDYLGRAREAGADLVAFPELVLTGYPPEDLLLKPSFIKDNLRALKEIAAAARGITAVVGFVDAGEDIYNAAAVLHDGAVASVYHKVYLPNYGVFDEDRYFRPGRRQFIYVVSGVRVGVSVCEDIWYPTGPAAIQVQAGARVLVNINASPYHCGKREHREKMLATRAVDGEVILCYVNAVGGQDELVFDGASLVVDQTGRTLARGRQFEEDLICVDLDTEAVFRHRLHDPRWRKEPLLPDLNGATPVQRVIVSEGPAVGPAVEAKPPLSNREVTIFGGPAEIYGALVLGTRDYVRKNGFEKVVIGLSGGIDSSLVAVIAADALGAENVVGVMMPSRYTSAASIEDAEELSRRLGVRLLTISIEQAFQAYLDTLHETFRGTRPDITEENIQARIRGNILMALTNKFHYLALTAGNKSETATGYVTLYGADTTGGLSPLKDVPKTMVYRLADYRNGVSRVIPDRVITKEPTAELKPDQRDSDTLPPYYVLDPILQAYVEEDRPVEEIVAMGHPEELVRRVVALVNRSEFKRRQTPPGLKVTPRAFGRDRRLPITNRYTK